MLSFYDINGIDERQIFSEIYANIFWLRIRRGKECVNREYKARRWTI